MAQEDNDAVLRSALRIRKHHKALFNATTEEEQEVARARKAVEIGLLMGLCSRIDPADVERLLAE